MIVGSQPQPGDASSCCTCQEVEVQLGVVQPGSSSLSAVANPCIMACMLLHDASILDATEACCNLQPAGLVAVNMC